MMKAYIVTKPILNIRSKASDESDDTLVGELREGETIYLDETEIIGKTPLGGSTNIWLSDHHNNLVSKDGVKPRTYEDKKAEFLRDEHMVFLHKGTADETQWKVSWGHVDMEIWKVWRDYNIKGDGVQIAIVDSGIVKKDPAIASSKYFKYDRIKGINTLDGGDHFDNDGHGTAIASILAGEGNDMMGIAPLANLFICKYYTVNNASIDGLIEALKKLPASVHIITISTGFIQSQFSATQKTALENIINELAKTALIFCSVGDDKNHRDNPVNRFPSSISDKVISVASIGRSQQVSLFSTMSDNISLTAPGEDLKAVRLKTNDTGPVSGTSFSAPFLAGMAALLKSYYKTMPMEEIKNKLLDAAEPLGDKKLYGNGIVNFIKTFL